VKWRIWWRLHFNFDRERWDTVSVWLGLALMLVINMVLAWTLS